ncbi:MAG: 50S ribosomal protein L15 [Chloroflexi bacterium]|nr:50S ribosomal protein L15 [Chloroflexota bacterium]
MKLHDLRPAPGAHKAKTRVGRGISAGKGKTAGRGTKGQKARAGGTIPAWFEGGQTPLHQRLPKLRGFRNAFRIEYEVVNLGDIARLVELGVLESGELPGAAGKATATGKTAKAAPVTVNQEILRAAGLVRTLDRPLKVLGGGELATALFVVADAYSASARAKIEAAGGTANVIEATGTTTPAIGLAPAAIAIPVAEPEAPAPEPEAPVTQPEAPAPVAEPEPKAKARAAAKAKPAAEAPALEAEGQGQGGREGQAGG